MALSMTTLSIIALDTVFLQRMFLCWVSLCWMSLFWVPFFWRSRRLHTETFNQRSSLLFRATIYKFKMLCGIDPGLIWSRQRKVVNERVRRLFAENIFTDRHFTDWHPADSHLAKAMPAWHILSAFGQQSVCRQVRLWLSVKLCSTKWQGANESGAGKPKEDNWLVIQKLFWLEDTATKKNKLTCLTK
jgi:hypothetical protein